MKGTKKLRPYQPEIKVKKYAKLRNYEKMCISGGIFQFDRYVQIIIPLK